LEQDLII